MPPKIDYKKCSLCGKCIFQCGKDVFAFDGEKEKIYPKRARECIDCFICMLVCPNNAVSVIRRTRSRDLTRLPRCPFGIDHPPIAK